MTHQREDGLSYPISYYSDGASYFDGVADLEWSMFLDSGPPEERLGRYDFILAHPHTTLVYQQGVARIQGQGKSECLKTNDPLKLIQQQLSLRTAYDCSALPFYGGMVGYIGYDIGRCYEKIPDRLSQQGVMPDLAVGFYDHAIVVDHMQKQAWLVCSSRVSPAQMQDLLASYRLTETAPAGQKPFKCTEKLQIEPNDKDYADAFVQIKNYIYAGDCYQVNLARRFTARVSGDCWAGYRRLRQINPAPFSAYLKIPQGEVLSCSPERFLKLQDRKVETSPIKGTRPRDKDVTIDLKMKQELAESEKDRAENLMIVDLLRNDLGRCCEPGSVKVSELFKVESFRSVHHLVSHVEGKLEKKFSAVDLLRACFPGGSITGAPKIRAMQIIEQLESSRRGIYCGSIGYIGYDGSMDMNIAIRTLTHRHGQIEFHAGGGIVADSQMEEELQEIFHKAAAFLEFLQ